MLQVSVPLMRVWDYLTSGHGSGHEVLSSCTSPMVFCRWVWVGGMRGGGCAGITRCLPLPLSVIMYTGTCSLYNPPSYTHNHLHTLAHTHVNTHVHRLTSSRTTPRLSFAHWCPLSATLVKTKPSEPSAFLSLNAMVATRSCTAECGMQKPWQNDSSQSWTNSRLESQWSTNPHPFPHQHRWHSGGAQRHSGVELGGGISTSEVP